MFVGHGERELVGIAIAVNDVEDCVVIVEHELEDLLGLRPENERYNSGLADFHVGRETTDAKIGDDDACCCPGCIGNVAVF